MPDFDAKELRKVFGQYPTGVTVVTTLDTAGKPVGMTANSFASVSLSPPLVLWSVDKNGNAHDVYAQAGHFCIHILNANQQSLSDRFANMLDDRFDGVPWSSGQLGSPLISECSCRIQCKTESVYSGGDHSIIVGEVICLESDDPQPPLLFHQGSYKKLWAEP